MKALIALISILTINTHVHSMSTLPSESIEPNNSLTTIFNLTFENFIYVNKVESMNLDCAEDAWEFGSAFAAAYQNYYGFAPPSNVIYNVTNTHYNHCVNPTGHSGNHMLDSPSYLLQ
ncbi:MAG: hypothetical protein AB8B56_05355 [Crocinitomicaceae bacterium]